MAHLGALPREVLVAVYLSHEGLRLGQQVFDGGALSKIGGRYRALIEPAFRLGAGGFLLAHNHPSGDARPSAADIGATRGLKALAHALEIEFIDHLVVSAGGYTSMRAAGFMAAGTGRAAA